MAVSVTDYSREEQRKKAERDALNVSAQQKPTGTNTAARQALNGPPVDYGTGIRGAVARGTQGAIGAISTGIDYAKNNGLEVVGRAVNPFGYEASRAGFNAGREVGLGIGMATGTVDPAKARIQGQQPQPNAMQPQPIAAQPTPTRPAYAGADVSPRAMQQPTGPSMIDGQNINDVMNRVNRDRVTGSMADGSTYTYFDQGEAARRRAGESPGQEQGQRTPFQEARQYFSPSQQILEQVNNLYKKALEEGGGPKTQLYLDQAEEMRQAFGSAVKADQDVYTTDAVNENAITRQRMQGEVATEAARLGLTGDFAKAQADTTANERDFQYKQQQDTYNRQLQEAQMIQGQDGAVYNRSDLMKAYDQNAQATNGSMENFIFRTTGKATGQLNPDYLNVGDLARLVETRQMDQKGIERLLSLGDPKLMRELGAQFKTYVERMKATGRNE